MKPKLHRKIAEALFVMLLLVPCTWAQQGGGQGGGGNTGGTGSKSGSQRQSPPPPTQNQMPPILFVSGTVVTADGAPLPSGVMIERMCNGLAKRETEVDSTGHFSFQIGGTYTNRINNLLPDASEDYSTWTDQLGNETGRFAGTNPPMGASGTNLMGCEIRATLAGYRSSTARLEGGPLSGQTDVGTIVLSPLAKAPGTMVSATNLQAPKKAKKAFEEGQKEILKKNFDKAENSLKAATEVYPNYAAAWFGLGQVYEKEQRNQDARTAFQKAATADSMYVSPYIHLARLAGTEGKWQEMANITDHALSLDPLDFPEGYYFNALANYNLGNLETSERSALKAQRLDGRHLLPQVHLLLANIFERKNDLTQSMEQLRNYLKFAPTSPYADKARARLQEMELTAKSNMTKPEGP